MAVTVNLKPKVDLPVWEWCRPSLAAASNTSGTCSDPNNRYIYYLWFTPIVFYRYDTVSDSWSFLTPPSLGVTPQTVTQLQYSTNHGYYNRAISSGTGLNTINIAVPKNNILIGKKIKILSGTGAGQERTITNVSDPIVAERGVGASSNNSGFTDIGTGVNAKQWKPNQWRNYNSRIISGGGTGSYVRKILSNSSSQIVNYDANYTFFNRWTEPASASQSLAGSFYQIETNIITVDRDWDILPDSTSECEILTDGVWFIAGNASSPFYVIAYYDVLTDVWYRKSYSNTLYNAAVAGDLSLEYFKETKTPLLSGTMTSATSASFTDTTLSLSAYEYNNTTVKLLSGTGMGQIRQIHANNNNTLYTSQKWDITPTTGTLYGIYPDGEKGFLTGNSQSLLTFIDDESSFHIPSTRYDYGVARSTSASVSGGLEFPPSDSNFLTRTTGGITSLDSVPTAAGSGYLVGQILTISTGGTGGTARVISINASGGVTQVALESPGVTYTTGSGKATTVTPAGGTGCTLNILSIGDIATFTTRFNHTFQLGDFVNVKGSAQAAYNGTFKILGITSSGGTNTAFQYEVTGAPTTPGTASLNNSTNVLVDVSKNWTPNEHTGKLIEVRSIGIRRISSNTSNTITVATAFASAPAGTSAYVIFSNKCYGNENSEGSKSGNGSFGVATSGTNTSLTDSTKNWPINYWSNTFPTGASNTGRKLRFVQGTGAGTEITITSNTSNTLTFATQSFTPDSTSVYEIMDMFGMVTAGSTTTMTDSTQNWGTNALVGKRVRFLAGTAALNEYSITANTQTQLTFTTSTAPDTSTAYTILAPQTRGTSNRAIYIKNSTKSNLNNRYVYMFRGGNTDELGIYDIYTKQFETLTFFPNLETYTAGTMYAYDEQDRIYIQNGSSGRIYYYDIAKNIVENSSTIPYGMSAAVIGNRMELIKTEDGLKYLYLMRNSGQEWWRTLLFW
jgi:hypothetical protein